MSKLGVDASPEYLDFYGLHPSPEVNPAPDNAENKIFQPYPALMQGFKILLESRKDWDGEMASWTYSGKKIKNYSLDELFDYLIEKVPAEDIETFVLIKENYDEGNVEPDANDDPNFVEYVENLKAVGLQKMEHFGEIKDIKIVNATEGENADYEIDATVYYVKDRAELLHRYSAPLLNDWLEGSSKEGARIKEADLTKHDNNLRSAFVSVIGDDFVSVGLSFTLGSPEKLDDTYSKFKDKAHFYVKTISSNRILVPRIGEESYKNLPSPVVLRQSDSRCGLCGKENMIFGDFASASKLRSLINIH